MNLGNVLFFLWILDFVGFFRVLKPQHSTGDKRSYDINSATTPKEVKQENQHYDDGNRNGTIKKRKSDV